MERDVLLALSKLPKKYCLECREEISEEFSHEAEECDLCDETHCVLYPCVW